MEYGQNMHHLDVLAQKTRHRNTINIIVQLIMYFIYSKCTGHGVRFSEDPVQLVT